MRQIGINLGAAWEGCKAEEPKAEDVAGPNIKYRDIMTITQSDSSWTFRCAVALLRIFGFLLGSL